MRTLVPALAMIALAGCCGQASAQTRCPELTELRSEADEAARHLVGFAKGGGCDAYVRSAMAWGALVQYASDHRNACEVSATALTEYQKRRQETAQMRDNVCAGRPARPSPADIIQR